MPDIFSKDLFYLSAMYWLRVGQKVLFICNLCWVAALIFRIISLDRWPDLVVKTIVVLGDIIALPLGLLWYGVLIVLLFSRKSVIKEFPPWLLIVNLCFLFAIVFYQIA